MYSIDYEFKPKDEVYIVDTEKHAIYEGVVCQFEGDVYPNSAQTNIERKIYLIRLNGAAGTIEVSSEYVFGNYNDADLALSAIFTPTPTPTPTPTISVTPSITPSVTPTATPTMTPTPSSTPAPITNFLESNTSSYLARWEKAAIFDGVVDSPTMTFVTTVNIRENATNEFFYDEVWLIDSVSRRNYGKPRPFYILLDEQSNSNRFALQFVLGNNTDLDNSIESVRVGGGLFDPFQRLNILISCNTSTSTFIAYVNDQPITLSVNGSTTTIDFGSISDLSVGGGFDYDASGNFHDIGTYSLDACINNYSLSQDFIDFTVVGNRRKFFDVNGEPVYGGADGSTAYGSQPMIWAPDGLLHQHTGSLQAFTPRGTFSECPFDPVFTSSPVETFALGGTYTYNITTSDPNIADTHTISVNNTLPSWLTFVDNGDGSAVLSGTHVDDGTLSYYIDLTVTDNSGFTDNQTFSIVRGDMQSVHLTQGSNDFYLDDATSFSGLASTNAITFAGSITFTNPSSSYASPIVTRITGTNKYPFVVEWDADILYIYVGNTTQRFYQTTATVSANVVHNILISVDVATETVHMYVDDVDMFDNGNIFGTISDVDVSAWTEIMAGTFGGTYNEGDVCLSNYSLNNQYFDFSIESNRRKFFDIGGNVVDGGVDGSTAYGSQPMIWSPNGFLNSHKGSIADLQARGTPLTVCP